MEFSWKNAAYESRQHNLVDQSSPGQGGHVKRNFSLSLLRALFAFQAAALVAYILFSKQPMIPTDEAVFSGATLTILVGLWWKRIYSNRLLQSSWIVVEFLAVFVASWIRHGKDTSMYGALCIATVVVFVGSNLLKDGQVARSSESE